jgi:hypothetical protein
MDRELVRGIFYAFRQIEDVYKFVNVCRLTLEVYRSLDVWQLTNLTADPYRRVQIFHNFYRHLPPQGSPAWKNQRSSSALGGKKTPSIGGSEIGYLLGQNKYRTEEDFLREKLGLAQFTGSTITRWGNLFEESLFVVVDRLFATRRFETGSIPGLRNKSGDPIQTYSPDGVGVVDRELFFTVAEKYGGEKEARGIRRDELPEKMVVLFEAKCPYRRTPGERIPENYISQPLIGAVTIKIVDISMFVDAMFRTCSIGDFDFSLDHNPRDHKSRPRGVSHPLAIGIIGFATVKQRDPAGDLIGACQRLLKRYIMRATEDPESAFHGTPLKFDSLMSLCAICDSGLGLIYEKVAGAQTGANLSRHDEESIVTGALSELLTLSELERDMLRRLVPDALEANFKLHKAAAKLPKMNEMKFGLDLGAADTGDEFERILEQAVEGRHLEAPGTVKIYYPAEFLQEPRDYGSAQVENPEKWLRARTQAFMNWCEANEYQPIGILPWKLFKLSLIPQAKRPEFGEMCRPVIEEFVAKIQEVRAAADAEEAIARICRGVAPDLAECKKEIEANVVREGVKLSSSTVSMFSKLSKF